MPTVQARRQGSARFLRAAIDGVQLQWQPADENDEDRSVSRPKDLPPGDHVFTWFAKGRTGDTYGFAIIEPAGSSCVIEPDPFETNGFDFGECRFKL